LQYKDGGHDLVLGGSFVSLLTDLGLTVSRARWVA
jgi:hypothetical protein